MAVMRTPRRSPLPNPNTEYWHRPVCDMHILVGGRLYQVSGNQPMRCGSEAVQLGTRNVGHTAFPVRGIAVRSLIWGRHG